MKSISRFLLISLLATVLSVTLVAALWSYRDSTHEVEELFDAELAQMARVLQSLLGLQLKRTHLSQLRDALKYKPFVSPGPEDGGNEDLPEALPEGHRYESKLAFVVWNEAGEELLSSLPQTPGLGFSPSPGYAGERLGSHSWRTFTLHDPGLNLWIKVGQRDDVRQELTDEIVAHTLLPLALMIPIIGVLIWLIVRRGLAPLRRIRRQLVARTPEHLEPLESREEPRETQAVVEAINGLLARLASALERERRFTADAAHELRTPLAGIRIHAQNLSRQLEDSSAEPAARIIAGVDTMTHVVEQLLTLSRLEFADQDTTTLDPLPLVRSVVAEFAPKALNRAQHLTLDGEPGLHISANPTGLTILVRNLLDNASRYTPLAGEIALRLWHDEQRVWLGVADTGPGIPLEERQRVLQRFYRLAGQDVSGTGLGLAIVRQICDRHGAELQLGDSPLGHSGLEVRVGFPRAEAPAAGACKPARTIQAPSL
ncbi:ATP-binding protein [Motiliproteus sp. SC1-56]|uniref:ATP-binding protein n=1 Tax=Motiliproteus sp. SC1-56 TaxID=2799565 RepID=UPI001A8E37A4|nr:ATP-binding protein [Motiliproteus sp. SC1-56]